MIEVEGWGRVAYFGSMDEAAEFRTHKARWEAGVAIMRPALLPDDGPLIRECVEQLNDEIEGGCSVDDRERAATLSWEANNV